MLVFLAPLALQCTFIIQSSDDTCPGDHGRQIAPNCDKPFVSRHDHKKVENFSSGSKVNEESWCFWLRWPCSAHLSSSRAMTPVLVTTADKLHPTAINPLCRDR